jgi:hypothetical protein
MGSAPVSAVPTSTSNYIKTEGTSGICPGDSGGAAYLLDDPADPAGDREVVAVQSCYRFQGTSAGLKATSSLSSTSVDNFVQYARKWRQDNGNVAVKGISD